MSAKDRDRLKVLHAVGRRHITQVQASLTYYVGWICALCGAAVHFGIAAAMFRSVDLVKRNLFEASMMFFLISVASAAREVLAEKAK